MKSEDMKTVAIDINVLTPSYKKKKKKKSNSFMLPLGEYFYPKKKNCYKISVASFVQAYLSVSFLRSTGAQNHLHGSSCFVK